MMKLGKAIKFDIHIEASVNMGYIATLGCAKFVFTDIETLIKAINGYLQNPEGHEKMFFETFGNVPPEPVEVVQPNTLGCV